MGFIPRCVESAPVDGDIPAIAIIIDDLGNGYDRDRRAVLLPGALSYAFLPHTPYTETLANLAHSLNKDVLLHLPMQSIEAESPGPGALTLDMDALQLWQTFFTSLAAVPHVVGINNHMGSLLTQHPGHMQWLMQAIAMTGNLFFIDSFTAPKSIAFKIAAENWIPNMKRDVFLDTARDPVAIAREFYRLLEIARKNGIALAIGHPYPETLTVLETLLPTLPQHGVRLAPVSQLIKLETQRIQTWRASLSP
ncbi:MAG: hypothetical protein AMJ53_16400 [Gammaproteobacteria bacterium SG8_11]|nr:MAG: hypothetical protein AMJ53_16400 [Gammaproteobacteria bacterium SG8_11]